MNASQFPGGSQQQSFHQDVAPILQQFAAKVTSNTNEGLSTAPGLVVMGNDGVRYHCTAGTSVTQHYLHQSNNTVTQKPLSIPNPQQHTFPNVPQANQLSSVANSQCYAQNHSQQKTDASTMTEKESQPHNETFLNQLLQQECSKPSYQPQTIVPPHGWQGLPAPGLSVAEYLSRLPASTLPYTLHQFLKFSSMPEAVAEVKKEEETPIKKKKKRKYKKKPYIPRPPRPRPGEREIRITTALDGSTLYCCPECQMAYPERSLLETHLIVHRLERRFVCNVCGVAMKRKEHLDRHTQGHNPDRPFCCRICLKKFKRNEHLSRHFLIHSNVKTQACSECGKLFYRKDHLNKHAQSHITKRLRNELMAHKGAPPQLLGHQNLTSLASMVAMGSSIPPSGITAVALMPGGVTVPILTS